MAAVAEFALHIYLARLAAREKAIMKRLAAAR